MKRTTKLTIVIILVLCGALEAATFIAPQGDLYFGVVCVKILPKDAGDSVEAVINGGQTYVYFESSQEAIDYAKAMYEEPVMEGAKGMANCRWPNLTEDQLNITEKIYAKLCSQTDLQPMPIPVVPNQNPILATHGLVKATVSQPDSTEEAIVVFQMTQYPFKTTEEALAAANAMADAVKAVAIAQARMVWPDVEEDKLIVNVEVTAFSVPAPPDFPFPNPPNPPTPPSPPDVIPQPDTNEIPVTPDVPPQPDTDEVPVNPDVPVPPTPPTPPSPPDIPPPPDTDETPVLPSSN
ncbi:MAG: hypothetical protein PHW04_00335 [Candidatus Wallbacteria bacterium]|nr:hypothetical protein [Candidatus Wallbacteria bacterium]